MAVKIIAKNRKAHFNYYILEKYEAGIELKGTEVKSVRAGKVSLVDGYASIDKGECILKQVHIAEYTQGNMFNVDTKRNRRLLLHRKEIDYLNVKLSQNGLSLIPLSMYFKNGKVKVELGLCKGKKIYDKRHDMAKRDAKRNIDRAMKDFNNR